jgi:F420-dependent oxidoreductase-like protein
MEIAIMIEGQDGLNWVRWKAIAAAVESLGFAGLYRSDHYTNPDLPEKDSLELWVSLTWLADNTERIHFGQLVSPMSFREPTMTARMAAAIDDLGGGRMRLGLGAGWQVREHHNYGWDLMDIPGRFDRLEDSLEIVSRLLKSDVPSTYEGEHYQMREGLLLPRPRQPGGPPITIGGNGPRRTLPLAARFADEWNAVYLSPEDFKSRSATLDGLLIEAGRQPGDVRRTMMAGCYLAPDEKAAASRAAETQTTPEAIRARGIAFGTVAQIADVARAHAEAGVECLMLQWLELDNLDGLHSLAETLL